VSGPDDNFSLVPEAELQHLVTENPMKTTILIAGMLSFALLAACRTSLFSSYALEDVSRQRALEQTSFEDSAKVFFATYPNPYTDMSFLWFAVFVEGAVEMRVFSLENDSLQAVYRFEKQTVPVHTVVTHEKPDRLVKCVLYVDGRRKCAKVYSDWRAHQYPQFLTQYTISEQ
jgi:hypothetical protein